MSRFLIAPPSATALTVSAYYRDLALTPGGTRLASFISDQELDVWMWDLARATLTRGTF